MRVACLGSGPSLTQADIDRCRILPTIATNSTIYAAPWADVCLGLDQSWWKAHDYLPWYHRRKVGMKPWIGDRRDVHVYRNSGPSGLDLTPGYLRHGGHSGYAAINYAVQMGATTIILLGYDMQPSPDGAHHHHAPHTNDRHPTYEICLPLFASLINPLAARGILVYNASRSTALKTFPCVALDDVL